ncbi:hypothetical protein FJY94_08965, partial [Candidatus Kaiserbacteria bacterium]|nr:hypothetical protein [Candidatus Kaiserbacteria bacterium]
MSLNTAPSLLRGTGKVTTAIGNRYDYGLSVTVQADGKILVAGYAENGSNTDFALVRYNTDGSLDTSFDSDGKVTTAIGTGYDYGNSVTVQADGKILVAGYTDIGQKNYDFAVVRYNSDGTLDTSFGTSGKVTTAIGTGHDYGNSVTVQVDGKILVAGDAHIGFNFLSDFALVRYNSDGTLDTSFGTGGKVTTAIGTGDGYFSADDNGYSVTVQADGKILVAGSAENGSNFDFALVRYNSNGSLDTSFSGDGKVTTAIIGNSSDYGQSVTVQADGKILVAGSGNGDFAVVRYNSDGSLDTSFSGDGKVTTAIIGNSSDYGQSVTVQADGKILVAGSVSNGSNNDFAVVRYNSDGSLDTSFDSDGKVTTAIGTGYDYGNSVTVQADGKILVVGYYINASGNSEFALVRYNNYGSLDQTFSLDQSLGYSTSPIVVRYTENGSATSVGSGLGVFSDPELDAQGHYGGATLTVSRKIAQPEDQFSAGGHLGVLTEGSVLVLSDAIVGTVVK